MPEALRSSLRYLPGLILVGALAFAAIELANTPWLKTHSIGALTLAILLGIVVGNTIYPRFAVQTAHGVTFSKQKLLRLGIILYGLHLTFQDIGQVGVVGVAIDALVLCSTFGLALLLGKRVFGLDRETTLLIGAGSSICGAAAVMATAPVVRGRAEQATVAVSTVVVFGTLGLFLYPMLYRWNLQHALLPMSEHAFGIFAGSTIHEVAQAVAAGSAVGTHAADTAVIAKMVRVMMLAPFLLILSAWMQRNPEQGSETHGKGAGPARRVVIPWFAVGFVAVAGFNSLDLLPHPLVSTALDIDALLMAMAMAALGLTTHVSAIRSAGIRPLALATVLFVWLVAGGLAINQLLPWFAGLFGA
ncbi:YeiH family protein [Polaromonas sp.]|uniref:YeiH family protein n=1 Tax=Polaromonas sp. TaxID=1869339 RepID=UPI003350A6EA